ncbi:hypothetical protein SG35_011220 [Thalassomonas actiniarum]|uniref:Uncharacterized protein n=1 Tax=Thalassomonas actiniarum TaxID=485447 RepID=A0AAE9YVL0_9GAMM|nr:hypothetical protein SG35_011220 [Thalassomonas actiniarum]
MLQSTPKVAQVNVIDSQQAVKTRQLLLRSYQQVKGEKKLAFFSVSREELPGISALLHRLYPQLFTDFSLSETALSVAATLELPFPGPLKYLNFDIGLQPSEKGLKLTSASLGAFTFPASWLLNIVQWRINEMLGDNVVADLFARVGEVKVSRNRFYLYYSLAGNFPRWQQLAQTELVRVKLHLMTDVNFALIRQYHAALLSYVEKHLRQRRLSRFVGHMFTLAKENSKKPESKGSVAENRAAILALVLYLGPDKFSTLFERELALSATQFLKRGQLRASLLLHNRVDLQKHFVYSMALQLLINSYTSNAIGEVKELLDAGSGSGFSFVDLLADKAGTRLAMLATLSEVSASKVQSLLAGPLDDLDIMPFPLGLPEDLHSPLFKRRYRDVNSADYRQMLQRIESLLALIAVYRVH